MIVEEATDTKIKLVLNRIGIILCRLQGCSILLINILFIQVLYGLLLCYPTGYLFNELINLFPGVVVLKVQATAVLG